MRRSGAVVVALILLVGCSGDGDDPSGASPSTTVTSVAPGCPALPAAGTVDLTSVSADLDGDARPDRLLTYRADGGGPWKLRTELAAGGGAETELPAAAEGVKALGGMRLDVGAEDAAFAVVGRNGDALNLGLFVLRTCRLERVTAAGRPAEFPVRGAGNARSGLSCQVPGLVAYSATSSDGRFFQGSSVAYLLVGTFLEEANRSTSPIGADDPTFARFGSFLCGPLRL